MKTSLALVFFYTYFLSHIHHQTALITIALNENESDYITPYFPHLELTSLSQHTCITVTLSFIIVLNSDDKHYLIPINNVNFQ